jgi:hypothetical protein
MKATIKMMAVVLAIPLLGISAIGQEKDRKNNLMVFDSPS